MASKYNLWIDYGDPQYISHSPYWIIAVIRQGMPLSFSRQKMSSITKDVTMGGYLRADTPLVITGDCVQLQISNPKRSCTKVMNASLKETGINYLTEILPGDWVFAWIVNGKEKFDDLLSRISIGDACNQFNDGLKFVGRVHSIRKGLHISEDGMKSVGYSLQCVSFKELETIFYFDQALASQDTLKQEFGQWMARINLRISEIFRATAQGVPENNINDINRTFLDLVVGKGPPKGRQPGVTAENGSTLHASPQIENEAPFSYLVPIMVANLLGKDASDRSRAANVTAYADILELLQGLQKYDQQKKDDPKIFTPTLSENESTPTRHVTSKKMLGTFLPLPPVLANRTLWSVFQQYLNPAINELYTCMRVNPDGNIAPTIVFRQIPFTTNAFNQSYVNKVEEQGLLGVDEEGPAYFPQPSSEPLEVTYFQELPRWVIPASIVTDVDVGRSDATRTNLVHVYGSSSYLGNNNVPVQYQMIRNPPIRDDLDIQRSGVRPYTTTVDSWVSAQMGAVPGKWMSLIADWMIGSHYTLNGTINTKGIYAPIAEGDNVEFDGCVYHIESVTHSVGIDVNGHKRFTTSLSLTNGMRAVDGQDVSDVAGTKQPMYPGFMTTDNRAYDPGLALQGERPNNELSDSSGTTKRQQELRQQEKEDVAARQFAADPLGLHLNED